MGSLTDLSGDATDQCIEQEGFFDKTAKMIIAKPLGDGKGHKRGSAESKCRVIKGPKGGKILAPPSILSAGNGNEI